MNKTIAWVCFLASAATVLILGIAEPWTLGAENSFLEEFVGSDMLNFLAVVVTITLASSANLHLQFNEIERRAGYAALRSTRATVQKSAYWLIGMLALAFALTLVKPHLANETVRALANGLAILIVVFNILTLVDLTQTAFKIEGPRNDQPSPSP